MIDGTELELPVVVGSDGEWAILYELQYGVDKVVFTCRYSSRAASPNYLVDRYGEICGKCVRSSKTWNRP